MRWSLASNDRVTKMVMISTTNRFLHPKKISQLGSGAFFVDILISKKKPSFIFFFSEKIQIVRSYILVFKKENQDS